MLIGWQEGKEQVLLGLWKLEESPAFFLERLPLTTAQQNRLAGWHPKRVLEWLASRYLLHLWKAESHQDLEKDAFGKPFFKNVNQELSISHSDGFVAVGLAPHILGLDIQVLSPKVARIAPKFLSEKEQATAQGPHRAMQMHAYWCAKEALYKAYGKKRLDFRKHIQVKPFSYELMGSHAEGQVVKQEEQQDYHIYYQEVEDHLLCYVVRC